MLEIIITTISFIGALVLALSVQKNPDATQTLDNGKKKHFALIDLNLFRIGTVALIIGFALQIILLLCK